jgi:hypothetical protein
VYGNYLNPPYRVFRRRLIVRIASPPDLAAPPNAIVLLAVVVVLPLFGRLYVNMLVDVERAPFPSIASRLSAASSNTLNPPLIRPYPYLHHTLLKTQAPPPRMGRYLNSILS